MYPHIRAVIVCVDVCWGGVYVGVFYFWTNQDDVSFMYREYFFNGSCLEELARREHNIICPAYASIF